MRTHLRTPQHGTHCAGFSLIEVTIAIALFSVIGYVVALSLRASDQSLATVSTSASVSASYREATGKLREELRAAQSDSIVVIVLPSGDSSVEFSTAIRGAGGPAWGAFDRRLEIDENACHKAGWTVRYTVLINGAGDKTLVRQLRDGGGVLQFVDNLVTDVAGFRVTTTGSVWLVQLQTDGDEGKRDEEFDVRTRDA